MRMWCGLVLLMLVGGACAQPNALKPADAAVQRDLDRVERIVLAGQRPRAFIMAVAAQRVKEWQRSAERGEATGQHLLALAHVYGAGVPHDEAAAVKSYEQAAAQGLAVAQFNLSGRYASGKGVPVNRERSRALTRQAAEQGFAPALADLGQQHLDDANLERADECFRRAAAGGSAVGRSRWAQQHEAAFRVPDADPKLPDPVNEISAILHLRSLTFEKRFLGNNEDFAAKVTAEASRFARAEVLWQAGMPEFVQDQYLATLLAADPNNTADLSDLRTKISNAVVAGLKDVDVRGLGINAFLQVGQLDSLGSRLGSTTWLMEALQRQPELLAVQYDELYAQALKTFGDKSFVGGEFAYAAAARLREGGNFTWADKPLNHALAAFEKSPELTYEQRADCLLERAELRRCQGQSDEVRAALNEATRLLAKLYHFQVKNYDADNPGIRATKFRLLFAVAMQPVDAK